MCQWNIVTRILELEYIDYYNFFMAGIEIRINLAVNDSQKKL
jgi:hypothetical protein